MFVLRSKINGLCLKKYARRWYIIGSGSKHDDVFCRVLNECKIYNRKSDAISAKHYIEAWNMWCVGEDFVEIVEVELQIKGD